MLEILRGKSNRVEVDLFNRSTWGIVEEEIKPDFGGRIKYQFSSWLAKEINNQRVVKGERVFVVKREGMFQLVQRSI